jgi:transposase
MMNNNNRLNLKEKAIQMKTKGYSVTDAADALNVPKSTVWDWFNDRKRN